MGKIGSNTAKAYGKLDDQKSRTSNRGSDAMMAALENGDVSKVSELLFNRFEEVILPVNADASAARRILRIAGAEGALMSGSGAAVFGIFRERERAISAVSMLRSKGFFAEVAHPIHAV